MRKGVEFLQRRITASGYDYPLAVPMSCLVVTTGIAIVAVGQRDALVPPGWPLLWALLVVAPYALELISGTPKSPRVTLVLAAIMMAGTALLLTEPVDADVAPLILAMMAGGAAASSPVVTSVPVALGGVAVIAGAAAAGGLTDATHVWLFVVAVGLGWMTGFMLQSQLRLMQRDREAQTAQAARAATAERQRIAREVHDVIAHSLSVTMLHLTGARRALQEDADVAEAIDALTDAERLGREAMADIRRTVGLLSSGPPDTAPEPGIGDLPDLVQDFRNAGLEVDYQLRGDPGVVSAATGLGLYRIAQESLANVAKHAPGASAAVGLAVTDAEIELSISNTGCEAAAEQASVNGSGNGVRGMRERVEMLGGRLQAGPDRRGWAVRAVVPFHEAPRCAMRKLGHA